MAGKLNVLTIHHSRQLRRQLEAWSERLNYLTCFVTNRSEGLALMYGLRPDLIFLEIVADQNESWQILPTIRLFTDIPLILIADQQPDPLPESLMVSNSALLVQPISMSKISVAAKSLCVPPKAHAGYEPPKNKNSASDTYNARRRLKRERS